MSRNPVSWIWRALIFGYPTESHKVSKGTSYISGDLYRIKLTEKEMTYIARALKQVEAQLNDNVILITKDIRDALGNPSTAVMCQPLDLLVPSNRE